MTINSARPAAPAGSELKTKGARRATANSDAPHAACSENLDWLSPCPWSVGHS